MRRWLIVLVLVGCGHTDAAHGGAGAGATSGQAGSGATDGNAGQGAADGGHGGKSSGRSGDAGQSGQGGHDPGIAAIQLLPNVIAGSQSGVSQLRVGSPNASTLFSLKYYITNIQLCESLDQAGSGYMNPRGCISLYQSQSPSNPDYLSYMVDAARADDAPGHYIDLMSAQGQVALRQPVTIELPPEPQMADDADAGAADDVDAGIANTSPVLRVFRFGLINFYRPIKVKAQFPIIGEPGQYFRTKAVTQVDELSGMGGFSGERVLIGDTLSGDTEETTYMLNNGGALFTFQKPFVITQADVDAHTAITVDLVFNPENFGQAYQGSDCSHDDHVAICDPLNQVVIDMPFVRMSPVPRKTGEHTHKETYMVDYEAHSKLRVELYYNDADPDARIQGVDTAIVYDGDASSLSWPSIAVVASNFVSQSGRVASDNATLSLQDYRHIDNLIGLRRRHDGTVTIHCLFSGALCPSLGADISRAYTYVGDSLVSGD